MIDVTHKESGSVLTLAPAHAAEPSKVIHLVPKPVRTAAPTGTAEIALLQELIDDIEDGTLVMDGLIICMRVMHATDPKLENYNYRNTGLNTLEAIGVMTIISQEIGGANGP